METNIIRIWNDKKKDIIWVTNPFNVVLAKLVQQCTLNF